jgi:pimeloyl-ACP methyl ester carboxylesterase
VERYRDVAVPTLLLGGGFLSPHHAKHRLDALASVLPSVESSVTLRIHGHGAHYSAPRRVARIIEDFVERVART